MDKGSSYIRRKRKEENFTRLPNKMLRDERLSWKARGLLAYMLSMPDDWVFYDSELVKHSKKDGITTLRTAVKELKEFGYLKKEPLRDELGKVIKWVTYIDDEPTHNTENLECGKPTLWENHIVENQTLLTTNSLITNKEIQTTNNIKDNSLISLSDKNKKTDDIESKFDQWYNLYAHKKERQKALKSFKKVLKKFDFDKLMYNTELYIYPFKNGLKNKDYQKYPATFLNAYHEDDDFEYKESNKGYNQKQSGLGAVLNKYMNGGTNNESNLSNGRRDVLKNDSLLLQYDAE